MMGTQTPIAPIPQPYSGGNGGSSFNPLYAGLGGALLGGLGSLFGGGDDGGQSYFTQIPGQIQQYLGPYMQAGQQVLPQLQNQYSRMLDPASYLSSLGQGWQGTPQYTQALQAANQAAAAGGMAGTPAAQQGAANAANFQYQDYLRNALGVAQGGQAGLQGIESQGFGAGQSALQGMVDYYTQQARMADAEQQQQSGMFGSILGAAGSIIGGLI